MGAQSMEKEEEEKERKNKYQVEKRTELEIIAESFHLTTRILREKDIYWFEHDKLLDSSTSTQVSVFLEPYIRKGKVQIGDERILSEFLGKYLKKKFGSKYLYHEWTKKLGTIISEPDKFPAFAKFEGIVRYLK